MSQQPATLPAVNAKAVVPEHSTAFMKAMSGGEMLLRDGFLFFAAQDWLLAVGYPLGRFPEDKYDPQSFYCVLETMADECDARDVWAIAPKLPPQLAPYCEGTDAYYTLPATVVVPAQLKNPIAKVERHLRIEEGKEFTAAHRRLWAEFLRRRQLPPQVRELFARTPSVLTAPGTNIRFLNAWNTSGDLSACLLMDYAPETFSSYIIGAHSRDHYIPHASDALFAAMLRIAHDEGKRHIHLGLGVNDGIRRFKEKWGGTPFWTYQAASWKRTPTFGHKGAATLSAQQKQDDAVLSSLLVSGGDPFSNVTGNILSEDKHPPVQQPYAMLWELRKNGKTSWIGGTAHCFRYSFASAFRKLFRQADTVIFEGPLDAASLAAFGKHGRTRDTDTPCVMDYLSEIEIRNLERVVQGPQGKLADFLNMAHPRPANVRTILASHRPWSVFFTLHNAFLERHEWTQSVDLEAWEMAHYMGRNIICMESIEEQIAALESVPMQRIVRFLQHPETWNRRMRQSLSAYLDGDLHNMLGTSAEFPTRTNTVIGLRDQRFRERMLPYIEQGRTVAFVGTAHMLNLETMLREDKFTVTKVLPTWRHKLKAKFGRER